MKKAKNKFLILFTAMAVLFGISGAILLHPSFHRAKVKAEENVGQSEYVVLDIDQEVAAEYYFTPLNATECDVFITNYETATEAVIPKTAEIDGKTYTVTEITDSGFSSCEKLVRVSIPSTLKRIRDTAFASCDELTTISLGSVEEIGEGVFMRCPKLETVVIPESVKTIGSTIFRRNNTQVKVRAASAGADWASDWNDGNGNQNVEYSSTYIEPLLLKPVYNDPVPAEYYFTPLNATECDVFITNYETATEAIIPETAVINGKTYTVTEITSNGFSSCEKLICVTLPSTIKKIRDVAFADCNELTTISLGSVEEIGERVFMRCPKLETVIIPESVKTIGSDSFRRNNTQVKVRAASAGANWASDWNNLNAKQKVEYSSNSAEPSVPVSPREVVAYSLAARQTRTDNFYMEKDGKSNIFVPSKFNDLPVVGIPSYTFEDNQFNQLIVEYYSEPIVIHENAFAYSNGSNIVINRPITIEPGTQKIFRGSKVVSVVLPNSISRLENNFFSECTNLTNIYFIEPKEMTREEAIGKEDETGTIIPGIVLSAKKQLETEKNLDDATGIVYLPNNSNIDYIGENAFNRTTSIKELHISDSVKAIVKNALKSWNNETQKVYVHNEKQIRFVDDDYPVLGWSKNWNGDFTNVTYQSEFYTVSFDLNGGTGDCKPITVKYNGAFGELPTPNHPKYYFGNWFAYDDGKYVEVTADTIYTYKKHITLVAGWQEKVILDQQGGTGGTEFVYAYDKKPLPDADMIAPEKDDYDFAGYFSQGNGRGDKYYDWNEEEGITKCNIDWSFENEPILYANWVQKVYTITYEDYNVIGLVPVVRPEIPNPTTYMSNSGIITLQNPTRKGYQFLGWYLENERITEINCRELKKSVTLYARWYGTETSGANKTTITMSAEYSIVNLRDRVQNVVYNITATSSVKQLYIYGAPELKSTVTAHIILYMDHDVTVMIDDLRLTSSAGKNVIYMPNVAMTEEYVLHLYTSNSYIYGANGTAELGDGSSAIQCKYIELHTPITIRGGTGSFMSTPQGVGGHGILLYSGGKLTISSDEITIQGGNGYGKTSLGIPIGNGLAVSGSKNIVYSGNYSNVILQSGTAL